MYLIPINIFIIIKLSVDNDYIIRIRQMSN